MKQVILRSYTKIRVCIYILLTIFSSISLTISAQVTIGSLEVPINGALLDIKQTGGTTKGLLLPRVKLSSLTSLQMGDKVINNNDGDGDQYIKHTGLMIYNVTDNPECPSILPGIYVWSGSTWEPLKRKNIVAQSTFTDGEDNTYTYKKFGTYTWMTQNVRTTRRYGEPTNSTIGVIRLNPAKHVDNGTTISVNANNTPAIPSGNITYLEDNSPVTLTNSQYATKFGLLYTQAQARLACPTGWHLPTVAEWNDLINALGGNSKAGFKMKANNIKYTSADNTPVTLPWNGCNTLNEGFNLYPVGYAYFGGANPSRFAERTQVWTDQNGDFATIEYNSQAITIGGNNAAFYNSVRCVKDY